MKNNNSLIVHIKKLSDIAQQNVTGTQKTNEEIKKVTANFMNLDKSAQNLRNTADLLAENISNFRI